MTTDKSNMSGFSLEALLGYHTNTAICKCWLKMNTSIIKCKYLITREILTHQPSSRLCPDFRGVFPLCFGILLRITFQCHSNKYPNTLKLLTSNVFISLQSSSESSKRYLVVLIGLVKLGPQNIWCSQGIAK